MPAYGGSKLNVQLAYRTWGTTLDLITERFGEAPTHLKIDVDGIESRILRGSGETLRKVASVLIELETHDTTGAAEISKSLTTAGLSRSTIEYHEGAGVRNEIWKREK